MTVIEEIKRANKLLIVGHIRPDGDCLGAGLALRRLAIKLGKIADVVYDSELPENYSFMSDFDKINPPIAQKPDYDLLLIVDCGDMGRMGKYYKYLGKIRSIQIDHHTGNALPADVNIVYSQKGSTCQIIADMIFEAGLMDKEIGSLLYVGISTDTGHFMHNTSTAEVFDIVAKLLDVGVENYPINNLLYRSRTIKKTKLIGKAINSMRFFKENFICIVTVFQKDLDELGCDIADTEGLVDVAMDIGNVGVAVCMTEKNDNHFKISLRSKGFPVNECARIFGGGGHVQAAGCVISGMYEDVVDKILKSIADVTE